MKPNKGEERIRYVVPKYGTRLVKEDWSKAREHCLSIRGDLASIGSQKEQKKVLKIVAKFSRESFWIGANDIKREGRFEWSDGSPFSFTKWWAREPNNKGSRGQEDCVHLKRSGYKRAWNDLACSFSLPFICKIPYLQS